MQRTRQRMIRRSAALALALALPAATVWAGNDDDRQPRERAPQLTLQAEAATKVQQDTVVLTLAYEAEAADQANVSRELNEHLDAAMKMLRDEKGVKARNGNYRIWPQNDRDGRISAWRGRTEILLESTDFAKASALAAKVQNQMPLDNIAFILSSEARAKHEERLLQQAADAFRQRAQAAAEAFGFKAYEIRKIDLGGGGVQYEMAPRPQMMMAKAAGAAADSVPLEADTVTVSVSVSGTVALKP
ncbi:SIMPL domain-containing protein [Kerstersia sp.]|uniref:SIMPL domain-containing protein n=1 Tax=Kerstersia sp. TaxID=1930783 RepID=UPI003F91B836